MGRFDMCVCVCVHLVISLSKIRYALLNDVSRGWSSGRKKFLVELLWDFFVVL